MQGEAGMGLTCVDLLCLTAAFDCKKNVHLRLALDVAVKLPCGF